MHPERRRMRLRYPGQCRRCGTRLEAGTLASYERSSRTVQCADCALPAAPAGAARRMGASPIAPTPEVLPVLTAPASTVARTPASPPRHPDALRLRAPASAVILETMRVQASAPPRSTSDKIFGRDPLSPEGRSWFLGALGELEVGRLLDQLGPGWRAIHAIPVGTAGSDLDHLVIGPTGVYTINSKFHRAKKVWVGGKRLLVNGQRTDHLRNAAFEARRVSKTLSRSLGRPVPVAAVIAIVGARSITVRERPDDVAVVSSSKLVPWLVRRPRVLSEHEVGQVVGTALDAATWGDPAVPEADLVGFAALRESIESAARRRLGWVLVPILGFCVVLPAGAIAAGVLTLLR